MHAAIEEILEAVFSMRFVASLYYESVENVKTNRIGASRVDAGS
jgi:hypothetical protein